MTETWYHARKEPIEAFAPDTLAFFTVNDDDLSLWAGKSGYVVTADLLISNPIGDLALHKLALEMGLEDCYDEAFSDFPDVSSYLYNPDVRRRLENMGYDGYEGEDGYLWVAVVWNPEQIRILSHEEYVPASERPAPVA